MARCEGKGGVSSRIFLPSGRDGEEGVVGGSPGAALPSRQKYRCVHAAVGKTVLAPRGGGWPTPDPRCCRTSQYSEAQRTDRKDPADEPGGGLNPLLMCLPWLRWLFFLFCVRPRPDPA